MAFIDTIASYGFYRFYSGDTKLATIVYDQVSVECGQGKLKRHDSKDCPHAAANHWQQRLTVWLPQLHGGRQGMERWVCDSWFLSQIYATLWFSRRLENPFKGLLHINFLFPHFYLFFAWLLHFSVHFSKLFYIHYICYIHFYGFFLNGFSHLRQNVRPPLRSARHSLGAHSQDRCRSHTLSILCFVKKKNN